jgi:hypothetical protein
VQQLSDELAAVVSAAEKLRAADPVMTDADEILAEVAALLDVANAVSAALVRRLHSAACVNATDEIAGQPLRSWLRVEQRLPRAEASRLVRLAEHLGDAPAVRDAFHLGEISDRHASAILTALHSVPAEIRPAFEEACVDFARHCPPDEIAGFADALLDGLGIDKDSDLQRERRHARRGLDLVKTLYGDHRLSGTLSPEVGAKVAAAFALAAAPAGPDDERTLRQRQHDALGAIADHYLASQAPAFTGAPRTVIVTVPLDVLEGRLRDALVPVPGGELSADTARRLACDAALIPAVLGGASEILDLGQAGHEFTVAVRRAAWLRDGGSCAFPDCDRPVAELHHVTFRRHGGTNSLENAAWLCSYHHWLAHEGGWTLRRAPDGGHCWTGPHGQTRHRPPGPPPRPRPQDSG